MQTVNIDDAASVSAAVHADRLSSNAEKQQRKARENAKTMLLHLVDQELDNGRSGSDLASAIIDACPGALKLDDFPFFGALTRVALKVMEDRYHELHPSEKTVKVRRYKRAKPRRGSAEAHAAADASTAAGAAEHADERAAAVFSYFVAGFDCELRDMTKEKLVAWGTKSKVNLYIATTLSASLKKATDTVKDHHTDKALAKIVQEAQAKS